MSLEQNTNMDDLSGYFLLNSVGRVNVYPAPEKYFDALCDIILLKVKLSALKEKEIFSIPAMYFSSFPGQILSKIKAAEEEPLTPVLDSLPKKDIYTVPDGYFNKFSNNFLSEIRPESIDTGAKIIPLITKRRSWRMGVAAAIVSAIVLSSGLIWENNKQQPKAKTPYAAVIQKDLSSLSTGDIADYLSAPDASIDEEPVYEGSDTDTKNELKNISGSEVETYLNQTPAMY